VRVHRVGRKETKYVIRWRGGKVTEERMQKVRDGAAYAVRLEYGQLLKSQSSQVALQKIDSPCFHTYGYRWTKEELMAYKNMCQKLGLDVGCLIPKLR